MKTPEQMAEEWAKLEAAIFDMDCDVRNGGDDKQVCLNCRHIYWGIVRGFLAGYKAAKDNQEYLMNEMSILRSRLDTAEKLSQLVDENKEQ